MVSNVFIVDTSQLSMLIWLEPCVGSIDFRYLVSCRNLNLEGLKRSNVWYMLAAAIPTLERDPYRRVLHDTGPQNAGDRTRGE